MKCAYCALHSRAGSTADARDDYVKRLAAAVAKAPEDLVFKTVYFGGGTPALCNLEPLFEALAPRVANGTEWTVELNPLDVDKNLLQRLNSGGVNRISMGVQSLDDAVLAAMKRGYTFTEAEKAFYLIKEYFDNAGIDLIVGYPGETSALLPRHARLAKWNLKHCSAYSLIVEENTLISRRLNEGALTVPDDDTVMNRLGIVASFLEDIGLKRYEVSNYSKPGFECRHNLAVWQGEDYFGLGEGASGRIGLLRTHGLMTLDPAGAVGGVESVSEEHDRKERFLFTLRTRFGLDTSKLASTDRDRVIEVLNRSLAGGLAEKDGDTYRLSARGLEVCDSVLAELI